VGELNNPIDLTTLANVQAWLGISGESENNVINDCITAASSYWLWALGLTQQNGEPWSTDPEDDPCSPLNSVVTTSETYDGPGSARLFLRIRPIVSVASLTVDGISIPASTAVTVPGYVIDGSGKSLAIRSGSGGPGIGGGALTVGFAFLRNRQRSSWFFAEGIQNVAVTYSAGYEETPPDIEMAVRQMVSVNYKRRQWIDQRTQMMAQGAGSIQFRDWELPPEVRSVMEHYKRRAIS
jgi:hypothetical protein